MCPNFRSLQSERDFAMAAKVDATLREEAEIMKNRGDWVVGKGKRDE
jgi:hypothetical protein